jgi:hypothetical protein
MLKSLRFQSRLIRRANSLLVRSCIPRSSIYKISRVSCLLHQTGLSSILLVRSRRRDFQPSTSIFLTYTLNRIPEQFDFRIYFLPYYLRYYPLAR